MIQKIKIKSLTRKMKLTPRHDEEKIKSLDLIFYFSMDAIEYMV